MVGIFVYHLKLHCPVVKAWTFFGLLVLKHCSCRIFWGLHYFKLCA
jgi:hypothetical protein